jgi:F-type H+-transporting ATPase subunit b
MATMTTMGMQHQGRTKWVAAVLVGGWLACAPPPVGAQQPDPSATPKAEAAADHAPASGDHATPAANHGAAQAGDHGAAASHGTGEAEHGESILVTLARLANFAILAGVIWWFARKPLAAHLATRGAQIRKDLVDAAEMRTTATARLAEIEAKLAALPAELEGLRRRGAEELDAERARIKAAAEIERDRLVDQARREIASQTRTARGQLRAHAASLAIDVAESRLRETLTPAEQSALVDSYAAQMRNVQ